MAMLAFLMQRPGLRLAVRRLPRRITASVTAFALALQTTAPALAQSVTADPAAGAGNRPSVGAAPNGVPTVNIARPNGSGLSHNKYRDYNVGKNGLILNNSKSAGRSVLGGTVLANPNLAGGATARVILNEVTSSNPSVLNGYTEVFGSSADVIVANPNGITCDGCGFINTPRATLTTGTPVLDPTTNALMGFSVNQGVVDVGALGLDASTVDYFDIVSRSVLINGVVQGKDVGIYAGRNTFDYIARTATAMSTDADGKPEFGIDSSMLGGMYAGRIKLVGTEKGVGVRTPPKMSASAGGMTITADGRLVLRGTVTAKQRVAARSAKSKIDVEGTLYSQEAVALDAVDGIALASDGIIAAAGDVDLISRAGAIAASAGSKIIAGLDANGNLGATGRLRLAAATQLIAGDAFLAAGSALDISAQDIDLRRVASGDAANVFSNGSLSLTGPRVRAKGSKIASRGEMRLTAPGDLELDGGVLVTDQRFTLAAQSFSANADISAGGSADLTATGGGARFTGRVIGNGLSLVASGAVDASGTLSSIAALHLAAGTTLTTSATLASNGALDVTSGGSLTNTGAVASQSAIRLSAVQGLDNRGSVASEGTAALGAGGDLSNSGSVAARAKVTLTAGGNVSNAASSDIRTAAGVDLMAGGGLVNFGGVTADGAVTFVAGTSFENGASGQVVSNGAVSIDAQTRIANAGLVSSGAGTTATASAAAAVIDNSGRLLSDGKIALGSAGTATNRGEISTLGDVGVQASGDVANAGGGRIAANGRADLASRTGAVSNAGEITTAGGVGLTAKSNIDNTGHVTSNTTITAAAGDTLVNSGTLSAQRGITALAGGTLTNAKDALINGGAGPLSLTVANLSNAGRLGTQGDVAVMATGNVDNNGLIYAGQNATFLLDGALRNTAADIIAEGNLAIAGRMPTTRAATVRNTSGLIEAGADLTVEAQSLVNEAPEPVITTLSAPSETTESGRVSIGDNFYTYTTTTTTVSTQTVPPSPPAAAQLLSGRNMVLSFDDATNAYSLIAAGGNIVASGGTLTNTGVDLIETTDSERYVVTQEYYCRPQTFGSCDWDWRTISRVTYKDVATKTIDAVHATIQAGGTVTATLSGYVTNESVRDGAGQAGLVSGSFAAAAVSTGGTGAAGSGPAVSGPASVTPDGLAAGEVANLIGRDQLFVTNSGSDARYLIETRREFVDPGLFYGSDYFLSQAGFNPDVLTKRLGDAYFEDRFIRDQILKLAGKRFLDGYTSDLELVKALYANALQQQKELNLSPGVSLTPGQVSSLTRDIVWLELITVNGQTVLAPRVYLAASRPQNFDVAGARITGNNVGITAQGVVNSGAIVAANDLTVIARIPPVAGIDPTTQSITTTALFGVQSQVAAGLSAAVADALRPSPLAGRISNVGGYLGAGNTVSLVADDTVANLSGEISGANVTIRAGNILNSTVVTRDGNATSYQDRLSQPARIIATNDLTLVATQNILAEGGTFSAGRDLTAVAGGSIVMQAVAQEMARDDKGRGWFDRESGVAHTPGRIDAGGNVVLDAGQDIGLSGIAVTAGGSVDLMAVKDITIAAVTDAHQREGEAKGKSGGFLSGSWSVERQSQSATAVASALDAGGGVAITAGVGDIVVTGSDLSAGADIGLTAGGGVSITAAKETSSKSRNESDKGFLSKSQAKDKEAIVAHRGSALAADGDISVTAKAGDAKVSGSGISSAGDVAISATGDVRLDAVEDTYTSYSYRKTSGVFAESFFGEGGAGVTVGYRSEKTERGASQSSHTVSGILADGDIAVVSGRDLVSQAADARAGGDIGLTAARDVDLQAVYNRDDFFEKHKSRQVGLTAALNENITPGLRSLQAAAEMPGNAYGGRGAKTIATVSAGLKAIDTVDRLMTGPLLSAGLTLGVSSSSSSAEGRSSTAQVGTLAAGGDIAVTAGRDIGVEGTTVTADQDIALQAGRDLTIQSAESTASESSQNKSSSASLGVSVGVGAGGVSPSASASISGSRGASNAQSTTHTNAEIVAGGDVALKAGQDTTIAGAKVEGESVAIDTGRDLTIASRQDTATRNARQDGGSLGINAGPGGVSGSANVERGRGEGDKAWVEQQTTIRGRDGVDITAGEHTQLDGGLVTAPGGQVTIDTGTFGHSDLQDRDTSKDTNVSVGVTAPLSGAGAAGPNGENGGLGGTIEGSYADKDKEGTTRATVTDGTITTRDAAGQAALEDAGRTDTVAALNRDDARAQEVTKDDATGFDFYASDTSVKKAAEAVETAGKTLKQIVDAIADELAKAGEISEEDKEAAKGPDGEVNIGMPCPSDRECTDRLRAELKAAALAKYLEDLEAGRLEGNSQLPEGATEAADYIRRFIEENPDAVIVGKSILASSGFLSAALTRAAIKNMGGDQAALDEFDAILRQGGEQVTERLENWALVYAAQHNLSQKDLNTLSTLAATAATVAVVMLNSSGALKAAELRYKPGVASWSDLPFLREGQQWLRGSEGNAGRIPAQIAQKLQGQEFRDFNHFRSEFWRTVANDPVLQKEFNSQNLARMKSGRAPFATVEQQVGQRKTYELDHQQPIVGGGNVFDMNNIIVRTPMNHIRGR